MRVFSGFEKLEGIERPVVTMGSYDGAHCGHRKILERLQQIAFREGGESVVITFDPHPRRVLYPTEPFSLLNTLEEKTFLLESIGVDNLIIAPFDRRFAELSSVEFAQRYLFEALHAKALVVGYNHHFGHNREGNFNYLDSLRSRYDFELYEIPKFDVDHEKVSSTIVRQCLAEGDLLRAARYLGFPYFVIAPVAPEGRVLVTEPAKLIPPPGKYRGAWFAHPHLFSDSCLQLPVEVVVSADRRLQILTPGIAQEGSVEPILLEFIEKTGE